MPDSPWQKKKSSGSRDDNGCEDEQDEISTPMSSCLGGDLNSLISNVVGPGEYERDRKTDQQKRDHESQTPIRQFPRWKHRRGDLNQESRSDDVSGGHTINLSALQLLKKPAHNLYGMTIARYCGLAGKYVSGTTVRVRHSILRLARQQRDVGPTCGNCPKAASKRDSRPL